METFRSALILLACLSVVIISRDGCIALDLSSLNNVQRINASLNLVMRVVKESAANCSAIKHNLGGTLTLRQSMALDDCLGLFDTTVGQLEECISYFSPNSVSKHFYDIQSLLSATITNQDTCEDGLSNSSDREVKKLLVGRLEQLKRMLDESLSMFQTIPAPTNEKRKRTFEATNPNRVNSVVAIDGSGNYRTIMEAINAAPSNSKEKFVIHVKKGVYSEYVNVESNKINIVLMGDGIQKTKITGNRNHHSGTSTFMTATVIIEGKGFVMRDITVENSSGPENEQAAAFRSNAEFTVCYRCRFVGYQDTLYAHSRRQFYRDCEVYGTVDFVFGNAAAVFQNCSFYPRRPIQGQSNTITTQARDSNSPITGFAMQGCKFSPSEDLRPVKFYYKTYLGRPWNQFSTTVIMTSYIDDMVDPAGWLAWEQNNPQATIYYGEYMNHGPGADTKNRVKWSGYHVMTKSDTNKFQVEPFIQGSEWLPSTGIPYDD